MENFISIELRTIVKTKNRFHFINYVFFSQMAQVAHTVLHPLAGLFQDHLQKEMLQVERPGIPLDPLQLLKTKWTISESLLLNLPLNLLG